MRLNELLANINRETFIKIKVDDDHCFMGRRFSLDSYDYYQKNRKRYGNAIVTNISLDYGILETHIFIEAETTMVRWTKKVVNKIT
jgi:hypothetical protein|nr:MAG TPA: hypothetical protein [Caudoviricetes sp.]